MYGNEVRVCNFLYRNVVIFIGSYRRNWKGDAMLDGVIHALFHIEIILKEEKNY